jgi:hypothetical protein
MVQAIVYARHALKIVETIHAYAWIEENAPRQEISPESWLVWCRVPALPLEVLL